MKIFESRMTFFLGFIVMISLAACNNEQLILQPTPETLEPEPTAEEGFADVDQALWSYYADFEVQAAARGLAIDLRNLGITGSFEDIEGEHVAGQCSFRRFTPNQVTIDIEFWRRASNNLREMIVFHELGHCVLLRGHEEATLSNGACASIMRSGNEACLDNYRSVTRSFYLDELFQNHQLD